MLAGSAIEPHRPVIPDDDGEDGHSGARRGHWHEAGPEGRGAIGLREGFAGLIEGGLG